ncbi:MAG: hypothetical protein LBQ66_12995 [Planctomycetaceae bacterium]|nr:hypothetical protein [Planctomycetaceae bacterium]
MAFSSNLFGCLAHRGGRDARVPVRAASRLLSATPTFGLLVLSMRVQPHCFRLAPLAENTTAQRSVVHLTLTMRFGDSAVGER